jgi:hypothetical protein
MTGDKSVMVDPLGLGYHQAGGEVGNLPAIETAEKPEKRVSTRG